MGRKGLIASFITGIGLWGCTPPPVAPTLIVDIPSIDSKPEKSQEIPKNCSSDVTKVPEEVPAGRRIHTTERAFSSVLPVRLSCLNNHPLSQEPSSKSDLYSCSPVLGETVSGKVIVEVGTYGNFEPLYDDCDIVRLRCVDLSSNPLSSRPPDYYTPREASCLPGEMLRTECHNSPPKHHPASPSRAKNCSRSR